MGADMMGGWVDGTVGEWDGGWMARGWVAAVGLAGGVGGRTGNPMPTATQPQPIATQQQPSGNPAPTKWQPNVDVCGIYPGLTRC